MLGIYTVRVEVDMKLVMTTYVRLELRREFVRLLELLFCLGKEAVMLVPGTSSQKVVTYSTYICCHTYPLVDSVVSSRVDVPTRLADDDCVARLGSLVLVTMREQTNLAECWHYILNYVICRYAFVNDKHTDSFVVDIIPIIVLVFGCEWILHSEPTSNISPLQFDVTAR